MSTTRPVPEAVAPGTPRRVTRYVLAVRLVEHYRELLAAASVAMIDARNLLTPDEFALAKRRLGQRVKGGRPPMVRARP